MGTLGTRLNSNVERKAPKYSEELIQKVLRNGGALSYNSIKYRAENFNIFAWESDSLAVTKSGYVYEYEIKISKSDFKNDFKHKKVKHQILEGTYKIIGDEFLGDGKMRESDKPNYFYYVVPENLISVDEIPNYAGLIYIVPRYNSNGEPYWYDAKVIKVAPKIHNEKIDENHLRLTEKFYYNYFTWKEKYQKDIDSFKERLDEVKTFEGKTFRYTLPEAVKKIDDLSQQIYEKDKKIQQVNQDLKYEYHLTRRLMSLLKENNINYQEVIDECEKDFNINLHN